MPFPGAESVHRAARTGAVRVVVCTTLAMGFTPQMFSQSYQTRITGQVFVCSIDSYSLSGKKDLSDHVAESCSEGTANGSSSASLDLGINAVASAQANVGSSAASGFALQTATLIPPKSFTKKQVAVSFNDPYAINLSGAVNGSAGAVGVCLFIKNLNLTKCQTLDSDGVDKGTIKEIFTLNKSKQGFQLIFGKAATVDLKSTANTAVSGGAATTSYPKLKLPTGWKCKYDSGSPCP